jgi:two-component system cell cycle sensor histidine kinase PleC
MASRKSKCILLVDDDAVQRALLRETLEKAGFSCDDAQDGDEGLSKCLSLKPDLMVLDVMMPKRDGFSVCSEIRNGQVTPGLPILMVTGLNDIKSIERAFDVGATNFLTKPVNFSLLEHHINYMLRSAGMEQQMLRAMRLAEEASAAKSQFLSNMSHELRTPLTAIIGFSEMISAEILGPIGTATYVGYAEDIHRSGVHLLSIINDILDISKIESGTFQLYKEPLDLANLFERVLSIIRPHAEEANVPWILDTPDYVPTVYTDELRLKQVLINLLSNAVKFTPRKGQVALHAHVSEQQDLVIAVSDTGIGMHPGKITRALSRFGQIDGGFNRKQEGTGLGLPLAKEITELLGGDFAITTAEGEGTTVMLTFQRDQIFPDKIAESRKIAS